MRNMKFWDKVSEAVKKDLLMTVGYQDPRGVVLRDDAPTRLTLWCEYLRYGFNAEDLKVKFVPPEFMRRCLLADDILNDEGLEERVENAKHNGDEGEVYMAEIEKEMTKETTTVDKGEQKKEEDDKQRERNKSGGRGMMRLNC